MRLPIPRWWHYIWIPSVCVSSTIIPRAYTVMTCAQGNIARERPWTILKSQCYKREMSQRVSEWSNHCRHSSFSLWSLLSSVLLKTDTSSIPTRLALSTSAWMPWSLQRVISGLAYAENMTSVRPWPAGTSRCQRRKVWQFCSFCESWKGILWCCRWQ